MPRRGPALLTSAFDVTLRVAGSMITIDLPSTSPMIQPAAWAPLAPKLDAASAAVNASTLSFPNMMSLPLKRSAYAGAERCPRRRRELRRRASADAGRGEDFLCNREDLTRAPPPLPRRRRGALNAIGRIRD